MEKKFAFAAVAIIVLDLLGWLLNGLVLDTCLRVVLELLHFLQYDNYQKISLD